MEGSSLFIGVNSIKVTFFLSRSSFPVSVVNIIKLGYPLISYVNRPIECEQYLISSNHRLTVQIIVDVINIGKLSVYTIPTKCETTS